VYRVHLCVSITRARCHSRKVGALRKRGVVLLTTIILVVFASLVVAGVTVFLTQRLSYNVARNRRARCMYLAQAGIHDAIYWFRTHTKTGNGYFSLGEVKVGLQESFVLGGTDADLFMVNTSVSRINPLFTSDFVDISFQNATDSRRLTIDRIVVTWSRPGTARRLRRIYINGVIRWSGNLRSPASCNIQPDFRVNSVPSTYTLMLRFDNDMRNTAYVDTEFIMGDGSTRHVVVYPASNNFAFTVKSTGKISGSPIYRTVQAAYNLMPLVPGAAKIQDHREINAEIIP